jgi:hypothetical protein
MALPPCLSKDTSIALPRLTGGRTDCRLRGKRGAQHADQGEAFLGTQRAPIQSRREQTPVGATARSTCNMVLRSTTMLAVEFADDVRPQSSKVYTGSAAVRSIADASRPAACRPL